MKASEGSKFVEWLEQSQSLQLKRLIYLTYKIPIAVFFGQAYIAKNKKTSQIISSNVYNIPVRQELAFTGLGLRNYV